MRRITEAQHLVEKGYLTVHQLAKYLQAYAPLKAVSYPTLRKIVAQGEFETVQIGTQIRVTKASIDKYCGFGLSPRRKPTNNDPNDLRVDTPNTSSNVVPLYRHHQHHQGELIDEDE